MGHQSCTSRDGLSRTPYCPPGGAFSLVPSPWYGPLPYHLCFTPKKRIHKKELWLRKVNKTKEASKPLLLLHVQYVYCSLAVHHRFYLLRSERKSHPVRLDKQNTPGSHQHSSWLGGQQQGRLIIKKLDFSISHFQKSRQFSFPQNNEFTTKW